MGIFDRNAPEKPPTHDDIYRRVLTLVKSYMHLLAADDPTSVKTFEEELVKCALSPVNNEIIMQEWIDTATQEFPSVINFITVVYPMFQESLRGSLLLTEMVGKDFHVGLGATYDPYRLVLIIRRMMLIEEYRDEILGMVIPVEGGVA